MFDIQDSASSSVLSIQAAHSDNIKRVAYLPGSEDYIVSAGSDKLVKLWDLRNTKSAVATQSFSHPVEDLCWLPGSQMMVPNGPNLALVATTPESIRLLQEFYPFQKPVMKVRYDHARQRILAGGLDG